MKHPLTLWAGFALTATLALFPAQAQVRSAVSSTSPSLATPQAEVQQFTLKNGLQLFIKPDRRAPTAVHMLWLRVGAMEEVDGTSGVAHVLEHMMFKGSKKLPPGEFSRRIAALGGQENAFTSGDYTGYYQQVPVARLQEVMRLEAERFAHNQWPDAEFVKEIEVVKEERRMRTEESPRARLLEQVYATSFVAAPYHRPIIGWMGDLEALKPADVRAFYRQWYVPANAAVVVVGDVDVAQVHAWAQKYYGSAPVRAVPERKPRPEPVQQGMKRVQLKAPAEQAFVALAFHVPHIGRVENMGEDDQDALALVVLSALLSGYDGARLERALAQGPERVADSVDSGASVLDRGPGVFLLTGVPAAGKSAQEVEQALRAQLARVAQEGVQPEELVRVKTQWTASQVYAKDSPMGQAQSLGSYWVLGMPVDAQERLLAALQGITSEQVQRVAARYFADEALTVGTLVPLPLAQGQRARPAAAPGARQH